MIKIIYILWFQGFDNAPDVVKRCIESWKYYNPGWTIILLDNTNLNKYININHYIHITNDIMLCHLSDVIRMLLLKTYGGLWVDATTFCNKSLDVWFPKFINKGFFAFNKPGPDRMLSNWFIYSEKNNYILKKWCDATIYYYKKHKKAHTYFIHHQLFEKLYKTDTEFRRQWNSIPKLSANGLGPHYLQEQGFFTDLNDKTKQTIDLKITPLYKLTYKCSFPPFDSNKNLYYLYSTIGIPKK